MFRFIVVILLFAFSAYAPPPAFITANTPVKQGPMKGPFIRYCSDPIIDPIMTRLMQIESSNSARAISSTGDYGLFQLNWPTILRTKEQCNLAIRKNNLCVILSEVENPNDLLDKEQNIKIACLMARSLKTHYGHEATWFTRWNSNKPHLRAIYLAKYNDF